MIETVISAETVVRGASQPEYVLAPDVRPGTRSGRYGAASRPGRVLLRPLRHGGRDAPRSPPR